ncbi:hypothetical protein GDO78_009600 [Eleutherodactylus coqui]|uniref:Uncharacterized protein n=1 Tax=Eleutherodactylus coqui TaxID=57060 RepID=A0A8J6F922_ELECQ|nr:hypothetical protein GDO78_009600 [Eleutherodactylus coqui]
MCANRMQCIHTLQVRTWYLQLTTVLNLLAFKFIHCNFPHSISLNSNYIKIEFECLPGVFCYLLVNLKELYSCKLLMGYI